MLCVSNVLHATHHSGYQCRCANAPSKTTRTGFFGATAKGALAHISVKACAQSVMHGRYDICSPCSWPLPSPALCGFHEPSRSIVWMVSEFATSTRVLCKVMPQHRVALTTLMAPPVSQFSVVLIQLHSGVPGLSHDDVAVCKDLPRNLVVSAALRQQLIHVILCHQCAVLLQCDIERGALKGRRPSFVCTVQVSAPKDRLSSICACNLSYPKLLGPLTAHIPTRPRSLRLSWALGM